MDRQIEIDGVLKNYLLKAEALVEQLMEDAHDEGRPEQVGELARLMTMLEMIQLLSGLKSLIDPPGVCATLSVPEARRKVKTAVS